jgi:long-chain fatty acid transport protein
MKQIRNITIMMSMVLIAGQLFAGGFALTGVGSRATSMGGAFRGLSDDASAMFWNPAGLGFMNENSVSLGGTFIMPTATWDPSGTAVTSNPGYSAKEYEAEKSLRMFPNAFLTMTKNSRLKYGLGVYVPYGLGTTWNAYELPGAPFVYSAGFPEDEMLSSIAVIDIHPTVAYQLLPNLSIGAGLSAMYGTMDLAQVKFPASPYAPLTSDLSGSGMGIGANMGIMFKPTWCMSIGLSGKLPSTIAMEGDAEVLLWMPAAADGTPAMKLGGTSDIDADLKLPAEIGIGFASTRIPNLTLTLDYAYTMWDRLDKVVVEMKDPIVITSTMSVSQSEIIFDWENTHRVSMGAEYRMGMNKLRMGFFYDQTPIPEATQTPTLSDISDKFSSNLGWGREFGKIGIEANAQWVMFSEREITDADITANNAPGKFNSNSISGNIGLTYKF